MKAAIVLCLFSIFALTLARPGDKYTDKWDNIDVDEILNNDRVLQSYTNCLLDKGPCTPEGKELKANLKEGIENDCGKCTDTQKERSKYVIKFLITNKKALWDELISKYDPDKKYSANYEAELSG